MTADAPSGSDIPKRSVRSVRPPESSEPYDRVLEAEIEAIVAEHLERRRGPVPRSRFDAVVRRKAEEIHDKYQNDLCLRIREQNGHRLNGNDREYAATLRQNAAMALWHATRELPALDSDGHPQVDAAGHLSVPEPALLLHFSRDEKRRARARGTPLPLRALEGEALDASLGILQAKKVLRIGRFKNGYKLDRLGSEQLAAKLEADGWSDCRCLETMALEVLAAAVDGGELVPLAVLFRVVRAKLADSRRSDAARGAGAGGCLLTLETLIVCRAPDGRLLLARVLDDPVREGADGIATPAWQLEEVARLAWRALRLVQDHLPSIQRLAIMDGTLPLGPSARRVEVSRIREPGADEHRATEAVAPSELLIALDSSRAEVRFDAESEVLADWTVLARAKDDLSFVEARHVAEAGASLAPVRSLTTYPSEEHFESLDDSELMDQEQWVVSIPRDSSISIDEEVRFVRENLRDERSAYPKRSAGHRVMFPGTNDPGKVDAVMQVLLSYALAEDLDRLGGEDGLSSPS
jgi:hypothetical protein